MGLYNRSVPDFDVIVDDVKWSAMSVREEFGFLNLLSYYLADYFETAHFTRQIILDYTQCAQSADSFRFCIM